MKQAMKQSEVQPSLSYRMWKVILVIALLLLITGLVVNFFDNLHYSNLLLQADGQVDSTQAQLSKGQYDVKFLINNSNGQINCYELCSTNARNICRTHDNNSNANNLIN